MAITGDIRPVNIGATGSTGVYRVDLSTIGLATIRSITIRDDRFVSGGTGAASGFDLDFVRLTTVNTTSASSAAGASDIGAFSFTSNSIAFRAGFLQEFRAGDEPSWNRSNLFGTDVNQQLIPSVATLGTRDGSNNTEAGSVSLGEGGYITFTLNQAVNAAGLYLYIGDAGGGNDDSFVTFSDLPTQPQQDGIIVTGTGSDDNIILGTGFNRHLGPGNDVINGSGGNDRISGGPGTDQLFGDSGDDLLDGEAGGDFILGGSGNDLLFGGLGVDLLGGEDGNDILDGGADGDNLYGGRGADVIFGGAGNDFADGQEDADVMFGGTGSDRLLGGGGNDVIDGQEDGDFLLGGAGNDVVRGSGGVDLVGGEDGDDLLFGGTEGDNMFGGAGNDLLYGEDGNDRMEGQDGNDLLGGNGGSDTLVGGAGSDVFYFFTTIDSSTAGGGADVIVDFASGFDKIDLSSIDANTTVAGDQAFTFLGLSNDPGGAGTLRVGFIPNVGIFLFGNVDNDPGADLIINIGTFAVGAGDFFL